MIPPPGRVPLCRLCGRPLENGSDVFEMTCRNCRTLGRARAFDRGTAVFTYSSARAGIYRFKYGGREEYADYYSLEMSRKLLSFFRESERGLIVPVPLSRERLRMRGYNQAALLAERISARTGIPFSTTALERVENTSPLKQMSARERRDNLKNAFIAHSNDVKSIMIMLIDDIYTTGATINACARACLDAGAAGAVFLTLAIGEDG